MPRGGKRKGGGRKPGSGKYGEKTIPIRVPISMVQSVLAWIQEQVNKKRTQQ
jgi:DNA polymerase V